MHNVLVTGSNGQLGSEIRELSNRFTQFNFFFTTRTSLDITDKEALDNYVQKNSINTLINCAAYTAVDKAEEEQDAADKINHLALKGMAEVCRSHNIALVHISTDYVFDGRGYKPYNEEDSVNPQSIYGKSKLEGEHAVLDVAPSNTIIVRTSWVYSSFGKNFLKTMMHYGRERDALSVVFDQVGSPTYAKDLAKAVLSIIAEEKLFNSAPEIYHYSNEGVCSWFDFAKAIMEIAGIECRINPIESFEYPTPVARPHYSVLNKAKIKKTFGLEIPYWKESLKECITLLKEKND